MDRVVLVRHAHSMGNQSESALELDGTNFLTKYGEYQARLTGMYLNNWDYNFASVFCSSQLRALQTTSIICQEIKFPMQRVFVTEGLAEVAYGNAEAEGMWRVQTAFSELVLNAEDIEGDVLLISHCRALCSILDSLQYYEYGRKGILPEHKNWYLPNAQPYELWVEGNPEIPSLERAFRVKRLDLSNLRTKEPRTHVEQWVPTEGIMEHRDRKAKDRFPR